MASALTIRLVDKSQSSDTLCSTAQDSLSNPSSNVLEPIASTLIFLGRSDLQIEDSCLYRIREILDREPPQEHFCKKIFRVSLKVTATTVSLTARIPFIPIAMSFGPVAGPLFAVNNSVAFFILEFLVWNGNHRWSDGLSHKRRKTTLSIQKPV